MFISASNPYPMGVPVLMDEIIGGRYGFLKTCSSIWVTHFDHNCTQMMSGALYLSVVGVMVVVRGYDSVREIKCDFCRQTIESGKNLSLQLSRSGGQVETTWDICGPCASGVYTKIAGKRA